jgi:hypothetical protein
MSLRQRVLEAGAAAGYPLTRSELVARLDEDEEAVLVVTAMADEHFVAPEELGERLDDALGMPAADPAVTMLDEQTEWHPE